MFLIHKRTQPIVTILANPYNHIIDSDNCHMQLIVTVQKLAALIHLIVKWQLSARGLYNIIIIYLLSTGSLRDQ